MDFEDDDAPATEAEESDPKFVTALARGLAILNSFRKDEVTVSNQGFAQRTGLPKATVTRLTYTLTKLGYLAQSEPGGEYRLAAGVLALGYGALSGLELQDRAAVELADLCGGQDNPNVAAAIGERHGLAVIYLYTHRAPQSVSRVFYVGAQVPLFHSSIGRAILMGMPVEEQEALLETASRPAPPDERLRLAQSLVQARTDYERFGYCTSFGDWRREINGIAAPMKIEGTSRLLGVNVGGFSFLNDADMLVRNHADKLLRIARSLSLKPEKDDLEPAA